MNQDRKDQEMPNRQSNMEQAEGSRNRERGGERGSAREDGGAGGSVLGDQESFEHGVDSDRSGEPSSTERGAGSDRERNQGGISNRGMDMEQGEQNQLPERGHSKSEM